MSATHKDTRLYDTTTSWESAVSEASRQILAAKNRIRKLEKSIEVFREKIAKGEAWPQIKGGGKNAA